MYNIAVPHTEMGYVLGNKQVNVGVIFYETTKLEKTWYSIVCKSEDYSLIQHNQQVIQNGRIKFPTHKKLPLCNSMI